MSAERRLVSLRRRVAGASRERYGELWSALEADAVAGGAHAWRFVSATDASLHLEFLEFRGDADPRTADAARRHLRMLDEEVGRAQVEEWLEPR